MPEPIAIRASSCDMLFSCPASIVGGGDGERISPDFGNTTLGKVVHDCAANYIESGTYNVANAADRLGLPDSDRDDAIDLAAYAARTWDEMSKYFPVPKVETVVESGELSVGGNQYFVRGTADVLSPIGQDRGIVLDWKTGYNDTGYHNTMAAYAYAAWCALGRPESGRITTIVVFLRHRYRRVIKWAASDIKAWEYDLTHNVLPNADRYEPGSQCRICDRYSTCIARKRSVEGVLDTMLFRNSTGSNDEYQQFLDSATSILTNLNKHNKNDESVKVAVGMLMARVKLAEQAVKEAKELVREAIGRVGPIRISDDSALALIESERRSIIPRKGLPALRTILSDNDLCDCMSLSLTKLIDKKSKIDDNRKDAANDVIMRLAKADAIEYSTVKRLTEVDVRTLPEEEWETDDDESPLPDQPMSDESDATSED